MSWFDWKLFVDSPRLDQVDGCRKDDLVQIANHFSITLPKQILKRELKALIVDKLVEQEILVFCGWHWDSGSEYPEV